MSDCLKIGMFSWESLHSIKVGGVSPHITYLAETLAKKGHEVHIFTRAGGMFDYDLINGVHYQRCGYDESGDICQQMNNMCNSMISKFNDSEKNSGKFDILHIHDWHPVMAMYNIKKTQDNKKTPWVMTFHSTEYGRNGNNFIDSAIFKDISHQEWLGGYESWQLITVSEQMRDELKFIYQIPDDKINVIPNGINGIKKTIDTGEVKSRFSIETIEPLVLFLGRMAYQKGPDILISAIKNVLNAHDDPKFVFAGDGDMRASCQNMATRMGIEDSCRFLGYVSDNDRIDLMNACDIYCIPSRNEPFGITVLEAWTANKPVLGTNAISMIDNFINGIKTLPNPESLSYYMNVLLDDPYTGKRMGKNGSNKAKKLYNWDRIGDQTLDVYQKMLT